MGNIKKGKMGDHIAEETALGWTLIEHLGESKEHKTNINLAIEKETTTFQDASRRLWDLDVIGIKDNETMYQWRSARVFRVFTEYPGVP